MTSTSGLRLLIGHALAATAVAAPWPALLAAVWTRTASEGWLGLAGASRLLPYVLLSALAGMLADRLPRIAVIRTSTALRVGLLVGCAVSFDTGRLGWAVGLAIVAVACATPAYPASVAVVPTLVMPERLSRWITLLVTVEVTAFVVGPAIGGLIIGAGQPSASIWLAVGLGAAAVVPLHGLRAPRVVAADQGVPVGRVRAVLAAPGVFGTLLLVSAVNIAESGIAVALLGLNSERWGGDPRGYGLATAAMGFGSLAAPLVGLVLRTRGSLLSDAGAIAAAGLTPGALVAAGPLAVSGAAGTAVECAATELLSRGVPDRIRAFALGLTDSIIVASAMLGAFAIPLLAGALGDAATFVVVGVALGCAVLLPSVCHPGSRGPTWADRRIGGDPAAGPGRLYAHVRTDAEPAAHTGPPVERRDPFRLTDPLERAHPGR